MSRATLQDVRDEFARGAITEADLRHETIFLDGYCDYGSKRVYVDPRPAVVETLIHELIHRRWPRWGEKRVHDEARRLLRLMTDAERAQWYRQYQEIKRTRKSIKRVEE